MDVILPSEKNVFILGAGFSRNAGLPLIFDFLSNSRKAISWLESNGRIREKDAILRVFEYRQKSASAGYYSTINLENIEELFSLATSDPDSKLDDKIKLTIAATIDYCSRKNKQNIVSIFRGSGVNTPQTSWIPFADTVFWDLHQDRKPDKDVHYRLTEYQFIVGVMFDLFRNKFTNDSIITFNYDLIIEKACENLDINIDYAIRPESIKKDHRPNKVGNLCLNY
jgi:hypothetical protein